MSSSEDQALPGAIFEESALLTVRDLSRMCAVDERHIVEFVEEGVLSVIEITATEWYFTGAALRRTSSATSNSISPALHWRWNSWKSSKLCGARTGETSNDGARIRCLCLFWRHRRPGL
jgi:hypothetical protein